MCKFCPGDPFDCNHCFKTVTLEGFNSVSEEYDELRRMGWIVVPHTGTAVYCSDDCHKGGWMPNPKYYGPKDLK